MVISQLTTFSCALVWASPDFFVLVSLVHQRLSKSAPGWLICLVQVDMVMVALSYGWYGLFFMKKLVDVDNEVVVSSVLIITSTIGLLLSRGRMGVPQRRYIYQTVMSSGRPIQYTCLGIGVFGMLRTVLDVRVAAFLYF